MLLRVKEVRCRCRLTQQQLADRSGCSRELISSIENQRTSPNLDRLEEIATALEVTLYDLLPPPPKRGRPCKEPPV